MLIVFHRPPSPTPLEAMPYERAVSQILLGNLVGEISLAVCITACGLWLHKRLPRRSSAHARIIKRINVQRHPTGMCRKFTATLYDTITETTGVVGSHRQLIACVKIVYQPHALYRVTVLIQCLENADHIGSYAFIANQFAHVPFSVKTHIQHHDVAQIASTYQTPIRIRLSLHPCENVVRQRHRHKTFVQAILHHSRLAHYCTDLPRPQRTHVLCNRLSIGDDNQQKAKKYCYKFPHVLQIDEIKFLGLTKNNLNNQKSQAANFTT